MTSFILKLKYIPVPRNLPPALMSLFVCRRLHVKNLSKEHAIILAEGFPGLTQSHEGYTSLLFLTENIGIVGVPQDDPKVAFPS
jgi:hypothetical protein